MAEIEQIDMVVVGAGFHGLAMARTHLKLNPTADLLILDAGTSVGGVWARDRLYPYLKTISQWGHFEYSDFPMTGYGLRPGEHMPGDAIRRYLEDYAAHFDLARRARLRSSVEAAEDQGAAGWLLTVREETDAGVRRYHILASKLVVATGLTSTPAMPSLPGRDSFAAPVFHSRDFGARAPETLQPGKRIVVLSGNKSACDVVYAHAASGAAAVHWIVRASGHGPCWMAPARTALPWQKPPQDVLVEKLITTRAVTWLNPCVWGASDGFGAVRWLVNRTPWGRNLIDLYAQGGQRGAVRHNGYDAHPEVAKLRPWNDVFWIGTGRGLLNYEKNLLDFVREGRVKVHLADVEGLGEGRTVRLSDGVVLEDVDAFVCCTGWNHGPSIRFLRDGVDISKELGLPHAFDPAWDGARNAPLLEKADREILTQLPRLRDQPPGVIRPPHVEQQRLRAKAERGEKVEEADGDEKKDPKSREGFANAYALYRFMVPPSHVAARTIAFTGATRTASTALIAQMQALWLSAYFMRRLPHLEAGKESGKALQERVAYESVLHVRFGRWRYPHGFGVVMPDFLYDALPYFDLLLSELGLRRWRKGSLWREVFEFYGPADYRGLTEEWGRKEGLLVEAGEKGAGKGKIAAKVLALGIVPALLWFAVSTGRISITREDVGRSLGSIPGQLRALSQGLRLK